ncbi:MAG: TRAP transporter small permease [Clostridiales bacterium]|nr:TRAP transporter small permease [Clostridiales bacterium]
MLAQLKKLTELINKLLMGVIVVLFLLMFGITNLNVIMRYFFNSPIVISVEMGRYCFVSLIFLGAIFTTKEDKHIHVDFFTGLFPEAVQNVIEQIGRIFMGIFFAIVTYETCRMAIANVNIKSSAMQIPMAVPYFIMAFGCAGITLESLINFVLYAKGLKKKNKNTEEDLLS